MMRNSRRGLAAGVNFIWDLPMTLLLIYRIFIFMDMEDVPFDACSIQFN